MKLHEQLKRIGLGVAFMILAVACAAEPPAAEPTTAVVAVEPTAVSPTEPAPTAEPEPTADIPELAPPPSEQLAQLRSTPWQWVGFTSPAEQIDIDQPERYRVTFGDDGSLVIQADCNNVLGQYVPTDGGALTVTLGPATLAACPDGSRGDQFVALLGSAARYFFDGDQLFIDLAADGGTMAFTAAGDSAANAADDTMTDLSAYTDALSNLTYPGPFPGGAITLVNGRANYDDEGSGAPYVRLITTLPVVGDLDGDGKQDALALLEDNSSGSGRFLFLSAVLDTLGNPQPTDLVMLGDRVGLKALAIDGSGIAADLISQGTGDAACCAGTNTWQVWELRDGQLVVLSNGDLGPIAVSDLDGTSWKLVGYNGLVEPVPADTTITAQFAGGQISGSAGCNTYSATVSGVEGMPTGMTIGPIATTQMACPETDMQQESRYLAALASVSHWLWGYEPGHLILNYQTEEGSLGQLVFKPAATTNMEPESMEVLPQEIVAQLDGFLQSLVYSDGGIPGGAAPGLVLLVDTPDGRYLQAAGVANLGDGTPMTVDDVLEIGSNTKSMTIVVLMQLVEEGILTLDDPLSQWLPEQAAIIPNGDQVTLRQLARHTSGIWDYGDPIIGAGLADPAMVVAQFTPAELVQYAVENGTPDFAPGEEGKVKYSNTGYVLLGMALEKATGQSLADLYQSRIFDPLGLNSAVLIDSVPAPGELTTKAYVWSEDGDMIDATDWNASQAWAAGAVAMTAADLATYAHALSEGQFFHNPETLATMLEFNPVALIAIGAPYGMGLMDFAGDGTVWGHAGQTLGYQSLWFTNPETGVVVVGLSNSGSFRAYEFLNVRNILDGKGAQPLNGPALMPVGAILPATWRWTQLVSPADTMDADLADGIKLIVRQDQSVSLDTADCGIATGSYTTSEINNISFELDASGITCGEDSPVGQVVKHLSDAVKWQFNNGRVVIELPADGGSLIFEEDTSE